LKAHLARAEALLDRLEAATPPAPGGSTAEALPPQVSSTAQGFISPPRRPPAFNTPSKLPPSNAAGFSKEPPRVDVLVQARFDHFRRHESQQHILPAQGRLRPRSRSV
jgi:hypothetical protein